MEGSSRGLEPQLLVCGKCSRLLPRTEFHKDKTQFRGLKYACKPCESEYRKKIRNRSLDTYNKNQREYWRNNREHMIALNKKSKLKTKYGLTPELKEEITKRQSGVCPGCLQELGKYTRIAVDHCHFTGKVRGLLCNRCNVSIGMAKDNPAILRRLADYLVLYTIWRPSSEGPAMHSATDEEDHDPDMTVLPGEVKDARSSRRKAPKPERRKPKLRCASI